MTYLADLYHQSVQEYTKTPQEWKGLLSCAARFYKRSFDNAVLIYAQRPNATQLGTFDEWHDKRIGRYINKDAKSVAVIDMVNPNASMKYLFDFMDTNGSVQSYRNLQKYLWELEEQYRLNIMLRFHEKYGVPAYNIEACLYKLADKRVRQWLPPYLENLKVRDERSPLYGVPEQAVKAEFMQLIVESVAYTVFSKCGLSLEIFEEDSFENIENYNTLELFMALGNYTVSIARPILKEIFQEIQAIKSERSKVYEDRTLDEIQLQTGNGRDDAPRNTDFRKSPDRQNAGGEIRQTMERLHDGNEPPSSVGTGGTGNDQRNNSKSGRGSRAGERGTDSKTSDRSADTGYRGHITESKSHEYDNQASRGDSNERSGTENQIISTSQNLQSPKDGLTPSSGDFFPVPIKTSKPEMSEQSDILEETDTDKLYGISPEEAEQEENVLDEFAIPDEIHEMSNASGDTGASEIQKERMRKWDKWFAQEEASGDQLGFFELFGQQDSYEDVNDADSDSMLTEDGIRMHRKPFFEKKSETVVVEDVLPQEQRSRTVNGFNYRFSEEHHLYEGGPKTKCQNNIEAIRLLKELHEQGRMATAGEQIILAKFVGWGGLANALTPGKSGWEKQYEEIKSLLTEEEFQAAQESTLTAYYTEQSVIRHIYHALKSFGFKGGNILDPAMATGNFFSVLPKSMADSKLYGVEIEPISGNIARQLYPDADIQVKGFENVNYPEQFFDVVIGNIPFNSIKVDDSKYNRHNFRIHDYFLAKSLDKTRPGGIVAIITSMYTLDKANPTIRKYLAQRAELIGAIRLPNNAFKQVAGTEATTDILFLKKREREIVPNEENSPWLSVEQNTDGIPLNSYFVDHPEMVLGKMVFDESMYGNEKSTACHPLPDDDLNERLEQVISYLDGEYQEPERIEGFSEENDIIQIKSIPADPYVRNFSYTVVDEKLYYREHSRMYQQNITGKKAERIKGLVELAQVVRSLIAFQNEQNAGLPTAEYEAELRTHIDNLNMVYDRFVKSYGYINSYANVIAFSRDANAPLLRSIEKERKDEKGIYDKTAMFYKATIRPKIMPSVVFSAEEALKVSLNIKGRLDLDYMAWLYRKPDHRKATQDEIIEELGDKIYQDPSEYMGNPYRGWQTAGEYLSGYVKDKLAEAILKAEEEPERFTRNVEALKAVQPLPLTPQEISFSLGTPWIPVEVYQDFMHEIFKTQAGNKFGRHATALEFSQYGGSYFIVNKGGEKESVTINQIYGTERMNAYEILETSLNLRFVEVRDRVEYVDECGEDKVKYVLNKKETILAREKQAQIKAEFERWLFADAERGARMTQLYNDRFNNIRPREYDGSDLVLPDLSEDIHLRSHQLDVVAHGLYGKGNLLMAHEVGAGKTYAAIVLAHEMKRLGKVTKPLITVPNHLVGQWSDAYMELYPNANILVAGKKDFEKHHRRRFVSRIATGDYECIIMAHSSFELIGVSRERQFAAMQKELDAITAAIDEQKFRDGKDWSLKQMQIFRKNLQFRFDRLFHAEKKDDVINFEELGVDALVVDEAHAYKNNFSYTKMRNVAGISGQSSQRAMDMHQKCQYINEIGNGKGVIYLTGTPVSNSMTEMYVLQKTLQPNELERRDLLMFDAWAGTFGKITSSLEIRPEGNGYQMKNRFAQFHNLPELMSMFSMIADIKTADMLDLPTPLLKTGGPQVIKSACTPDQKRIVMELAERAEAIRNGVVDSTEDNFLKLTHEARLLSIDPRAISPEILDDPGTKLNLCAKNVAEIYHETAEKGLTQLIFCDQGTPKYDGSFNFYEATKEALLAEGVKEKEIAFIHDAKTDIQREQLFEKVKKGEVRILMGSTEKMGTGMNVQEKLIALHHLDVPWRPSDLTQRNGRILRQGNNSEEISIFNYITENTFDSYLWQILEQKQRYISQIMTGRSALRTCEDLDETVLQYAEFKALATSDPRVKEKMETDNEINRLTVLKSSWQSQQNELQKMIGHYYPERIAWEEKNISKKEMDIRTYKANKPNDFQMIIDGRKYEERTKAAEHFMVYTRKLGKNIGDILIVGTYAGFTLRLFRQIGGGVSIQLCGQGIYSTEYGESELGNITRIVNIAERMVVNIENDKQDLINLKQQLETAKSESGKPFPDEERLLELQKRKVQLDLALEFKDEGEDVISADGSEEPQGTDQTSHTLEQKLYKRLNVFAGPILDETAYYMKLESDGFEDLVIENIGGNEYSIAHYYRQNDSAMRDPEITFIIDKETQSIYPTSYLQDDVGIFYETSNASSEQITSLKEFMAQWFTNIKDQGFEPALIETYEQENDMEQ
ncbi:DUF6908 domain-containing protein [Kineothrix alysoides]|nr:SNF2-related protein [Kineothrix alysoides]